MNWLNQYKKLLLFLVDNTDFETIQLLPIYMLIDNVKQRILRLEIDSKGIKLIDVYNVNTKTEEEIRIDFEEMKSFHYSIFNKIISIQPKYQIWKKISKNFFPKKFLGKIVSENFILVHLMESLDLKKFQAMEWAAYRKNKNIEIFHVIFKRNNDFQYVISMFKDGKRKINNSYSKSNNYFPN